MRILLLLFLLTNALTASSQSAPCVISLDFAREKGPLNKSFDMCVGAGRANEGLRADWQQQLALVQKESGFRYLRFHGLLHDDMGVYQEDRNGNAVYNWQYIDNLYDFLLSAGVKPFVELSFMPAALRTLTADQPIMQRQVTIGPAGLRETLELRDNDVVLLKLRKAR